MQKPIITFFVMISAIEDGKEDHDAPGEYIVGCVLDADCSYLDWNTDCESVFKGEKHRPSIGLGLWIFYHVCCFLYSYTATAVFKNILTYFNDLLEYNTIVFMYLGVAAQQKMSNQNNARQPSSS